MIVYPLESYSKGWKCVTFYLDAVIKKPVIKQVVQVSENESLLSFVET